MILLDRLEEILGGHLHLFGRPWVDADAALELRKRSGPRCRMRFARRSGSRARRTVGSYEAQEEAKRILRDAENYAAKLVQDSQILRQAQQEAETVVAEARREAAAVEEDARAYARHVLAQIEESLEKTLRVVRKSQDDLAGQD